MKIYVDPGHGGRDPGAVGTEPFLLEEKEVNLSICHFLEEKLENLAHWVVLSSSRDVYKRPEARADYANQLEADLFVSVHTNSFRIPTVSGIEVYHHPGSRNGKKAAKKILESLMASFPDHKNRGVKTRDYIVLKQTEMPAVLVEVEFISHPGQLLFLADEVIREGLAEAIATGIKNYAQELSP